MLNRLFSKSRKAFGEHTKLPNLGPDTCSIAMEKWPLAKIDCIRGRGPVRAVHERDVPRCEDGPIIILLYKGKYYLIDGQTRTNLWLKTGNVGPHDVVVIKYVGTQQAD